MSLALSFPPSSANFSSYGASNSGGYMNSPGQAGAAAGGAVERKTSHLTPLTVRQALTVTFPGENRTMLGNYDLKSCTIVGYVLNVTVQQTQVEYTLDDGTAYMTVRVYTNLDEGTPPADNAPEYSYVRFYGNIRPAQDGAVTKTVLNAYKWVPITDFNEISYHMVDVALCHKRIEKGMHLGHANPNKASLPGAAASSASAAAMGVGPGVSSDDPDDLKDQLPHDAFQVFYHIRHFGAHSGIRRSDVLNEVRKQIPLTDARMTEILNELSKNGNIFTTTDENTYAPSAPPS